MRKNRLKEIFKSGKSAVNGWLQIPNSFTAELMANQNWDLRHPLSMLKVCFRMNN